jgi:hypothetical protein
MRDPEKKHRDSRQSESEAHYQPALSDEVKTNKADSRCQKMASEHISGLRKW